VREGAGGPGPAAAGPTVTVVGSLNLDIVVPVPHHPAPGETVLGGDHFRNPGGKGANQAVAAARLGQRVAMVGRVGADDSGRTLLTALETDGVDVARVRIDHDAPTGIALIAVDDRGENAIVVSPGANARVTAADVDASADLLRSSPATLLQLEIPADAARRAAQLAGGTVVLNPAPAPPGTLPAELLAEVDVLVPNRVELAGLAARGTMLPETLEQVDAMARALGVPSVVVTLGTEGALVVEGGTSAHVPTPQVDVVDTTAAGDAFCGALADALVRGDSLSEAARWAVRVAAIACTRPGAQASLPTRGEVEALAPTDTAGGGGHR
jgi:ribokinase